MPGSIDNNGIYKYNETDLASPWSTLLNKLANTVSTQLANVKSRVTSLENLNGPLVRAWNINRVSGNETDVIPNINVYNQLVAGSITNAPPGDYLVSFSAGLSADAWRQGFIRLQGGSTLANLLPDYRSDQDTTVRHISNTAVLANFPGGTLTVNLQYFFSAGAHYVQRSGTHISVAYLGPRS